MVVGLKKWEEKQEEVNRDCLIFHEIIRGKQLHVFFYLDKFIFGVKLLIFTIINIIEKS